jgi:two-component system, sensor histidine kinase and response regulator
MTRVMSDPSDPARLQALAGSELTDPGAEEVFDRLTRIASRLLDAPVAVISVVDGEREFCQSAVGMEPGQAPLMRSFSRRVVSDGAALVVADTRTESRLWENPATEEIGVIAYCGVPLTDATGNTLGAFCVIDHAPRTWSDGDVELLSELARGVMTELELRETKRALAERDRDRKAAERRQAQLAQVVKSTRDAVTTVDRAGTITSWNMGAELLYGYSAQEMIGHTAAHLAYVAGVRSDESDDLLARLLAGHHVTAPAVPWRRKDGQLRYLHLTAAPLRDAQGEIVGATTIARDVTKQHRLETELRQSEARFRETFDEAPIGIALVGPNGHWLAVNNMLCEIVGHSEAELLASDFQGMTHPDDLGAELELMRRALGGEIDTYHLEKRYFHKRGHTIWGRLSVALVRDESGTPLHFVSHVEDITRSKLTELELSEGRRLLDESQAVAGVGSWSWNLECNELSWSAQQFQLHGISADSEIPASARVWDLAHPDDRDRITAAMARHMQARTAFVDEYRVILPEFGVRTLWIRGDFLAADPASGLPARMAGTTQDITSERAVQAARDEIENRQGILLSSLPDTMIVLYDRSLRCTLAQGPLLEQLGITPAEFEGGLISELVSPNRPQTLEPYIVSALAGEQASIEYPGVDGRTYQVDIVPYRSGLDEVTGAFTVWRDISERLERERQRQLLATIVEQCEDAIFAKSREGLITEWNRGAEQLYGYTAAEAVGQSISLLVPPERHGEEVELLRRALAGEAVQQFETTCLTKDGTRVEISISVSPLYLGDGSVVGASVVARDVTQRKQMEDELRASRERALETSRLKSEFVANMSHEIRTPLNGVVSMAELLLESQLNIEQRQYAQVALTSAEALMRVISDILDFSKIEAGKLVILNEDFSVRAALDDVSEIVGVRASERGLKLAVSIDQDVAAVVRGDGSRVRQVLMNLLSNAVKFTSDGDVRVTVGLQDGEHDTQLVRFEVSDTGIGIAPEQLRNLFQPFSQADATTTRRYGGTGLGLCISKQLVELMGGEIACDSEPGNGSRFWFTLPYEPSAGFEADLFGSDLTGTRVLIVDNIAEHRQMLESCLASWGISPDSAQDGRSALRLLRRAAEAGRPYETALLDTGLPGLGGLELAQRIRAVPALRSTRLIMIGTPVDAADAQAIGIESQLAKPVRPSKLYNDLLRMQRRAGHTPDVIAKAGQLADPVLDGSLRVLVAEDNEINQFAAVRLLSSLGFSVDVAVDGREAITMTARVDYAAVFMDCQMPNVDGYTATRSIRRRDQGKHHTPIIALTAHALQGDREKCLAAGMDHYLTKPLRLQTLEALMGQVPELDRRKRPTPPGLGGVFDPGLLDEIGDPETEAALAVMFLDQAAERLPQLMSAIEADDAERLRSLSHGLKGSAATVGATRMSELSDTLCQLARTGITPAATEIHAELADALSRTSIALSGHIERLTA